MSIMVLDKKYRKLSLAAFITGVVAVALCIFYVFAWELFDNFLTTFIARHKFMPYFLFLYISIGVALAIIAVITGSIDLKRITAGIYSIKGKFFTITGITLGALLILLGFAFWFVDFFGFINIIT